MNLERTIFIFGPPRSGTSWLGQILNSSKHVNYCLQPLFSYAFKDALNTNSKRADIISFLGLLEKTEDSFVRGLDEITSGYPQFSKNEFPSHLVIKHVRYHHLIDVLFDQVPEVKIIGIIRNPLATINSWLKTPREFNRDWDILEEWNIAEKKNQNRQEEYYGFQKWLEIALNFERHLRERLRNFKLVSYSDLIRNTNHQVEELFSFCELPMEKQTADFLNSTQSTSSDPYSVYRKRLIDDDWKKELDKTIVSEIQYQCERLGLLKYLA